MIYWLQMTLFWEFLIGFQFQIIFPDMAEFCGPICSFKTVFEIFRSRKGSLDWINLFFVGWCFLKLTWIPSSLISLRLKTATQALSLFSCAFWPNELSSCQGLEAKKDHLKLCEVFSPLEKAEMMSLVPSCGGNVDGHTVLQPSLHCQGALSIRGTI